jgi:hypothetical protein
MFEVVKDTDLVQDLVAGSGAALSALLVLALPVLGRRSLLGSLSFALLVYLYHSVVVCGGTFYSFQWDILLLEVGTVAVVANESPVGAALACFVLAKLMLMSGAVKISSHCATWLNLTALDFHFATQCLPTPLASLAHRLTPHAIKRLGVAATFLLEGPWCLVMVVPGRRTAWFTFAGQLVLQVLIALSGNYTFFNLLTAVLAAAPLALRDDEPVGPVGRVFQGLAWLGAAAGSLWLFDLTNPALELARTPAQIETALTLVAVPLLVVTAAWRLLAVSWGRRAPRDLRSLLALAAAGALFASSLTPLSSIAPSWAASLPQPVAAAHRLTQPAMLVSGYGLFRTMTGTGRLDKRGRGPVERPEVILSVYSEAAKNWTEVEFKDKPGDPHRSPRFIAPFQNRLDWQMWFAALGRYEHNPWLLHLMAKILMNEPEVLGLLQGGQRWDKVDLVKADLFHYDFDQSAQAVWKRTRVREYVPAVDLKGPKSRVVDRSPSATTRTSTPLWLYHALFFSLAATLVLKVKSAKAKKD